MNDSYVKYKYDGYRLKVLPDCIDIELLGLCCQEKLPENDRCQRVNSSVEARVYRFKYNGRVYYHKTFRPRSSMEPIKNFFNGSRATRGLRGHRLLNNNGFSAPEVAMIGHKGRHNFMVTASVDNAMDLYEYVFDIAEMNEDDFSNKKLELIEQFGRLVGQLHAKRIIHGDLRWGNVLITKDESGENLFWMIDNERTFQYPVLPPVKRLKNLVQLNMTVTGAISRTDRMRFFMRYLKENPGLVSGKKEWMQRVADKTKKRLAGKQWK
ncbi:MAG: hypothetical protein GY864_03445 [Desulfobacterales bacterium]|nr:hypothetical protein [Desulfobacterales bacterium]